MSTSKNSIGIRLKLDGLQQIGAELKRVGTKFRQAAESASRPFKAAGVAIGATFKGVNAAAATMSKAIATSAAAAGRSLALISSAATKVSASLARAGAAGGKALYSGIASATGRIKGLLKSVSLGVAGITGATLFGVNDTARGIQEQARLSRTSGTTFEKFSALSAVTKQFGMDSEDLSGALADLSEKMDDAVNLGGPIAEVFERAGLSLTDARGKMRDTADVFLDIPEALSKIESQTVRSSLATQLIAGDSEKLASVLALTNDEIRERIKLAKDTGQIVTQKDVIASQRFLDSFYKLKATLTGLFKQISFELYPAFEKTFDLLTDIFRKNHDFIVNRFSDAIKGLLEKFTKLTSAIFNMNKGGDVSSGMSAFVDLIQAAAKGAGLLVNKWSGVGDSIAGGLGSGIVALRDFASSFLIASGETETAGKLFGKKLTADSPAMSRRRLSKDGIEEFDTPQKVTEGYGFDFKHDKKTFNAAKGFASTIEGIKAKFDGLATSVRQTVVPAFQDIFAALSGDPVALKRLVDQFDNLTGAVTAFKDALKMVDDLAERSEFFGFIIRNLQGRGGELTAENNWVVKHVKQIEEAFKYFVETYGPTVTKIRELIGSALGTTNPYVAAGTTLFAITAAGKIGAALQGLQLIASPVKKALGFLFMTPVGRAVGLVSLIGYALTDIDGFIEKVNYAVELIKNNLVRAWEIFTDKFPDTAAALEKVFAPIREFVEYQKSLAAKRDLTKDSKDVETITKDDEGWRKTGGDYYLRRLGYEPAENPMQLNEEIVAKIAPGEDFTNKVFASVNNVQPKASEEASSIVNINLGDDVLSVRTPNKDAKELTGEINRIRAKNARLGI